MTSLTQHSWHNRDELTRLLNFVRPMYRACLTVIESLQLGSDISSEVSQDCHTCGLRIRLLLSELTLCSNSLEINIPNGDATSLYWCIKRTLHDLETAQVEANRSILSDSVESSSIRDLFKSESTTSFQSQAKFTVIMAEALKQNDLPHLLVVLQRVTLLCDEFMTVNP